MENGKVEKKKKSEISKFYSLRYKAGFVKRNETKRAEKILKRKVTERKKIRS
jgi:hypothetical protein